MTTTTTLEAAKRDQAGKGVARKLRAQGRVPAVLYGGDGEAVSLSVDAHDALHLFQSISVENTIIELKVEGEKKPVSTLVREIQAHPFRMELVHVDFLRIQKGVALDLEIPLHLVGVPEGVKLHGGTLEQMIHELPVRCIPSNIPDSIEVDVSALDLNEVLHVSDIELGEGVEVTIDPSRTICAVASPRGGAEGTEAEATEAEEGEDGSGE
ncbi:MAG: 50S ribosomal protein L25/general stress protein Ctc [Gemmatimonadota bacterium]|nr:50S ribosomal protein L25/general stress protein Ctc [Gemmatimonadota bacterium]